MKRIFICTCLLTFGLSFACFAEGRLNPQVEIERILQSLKYRQGEVTLQDGLAKLNIPAEFRFLGPEDAQTVLVKLWGNPPGAAPLGMLVPANLSPASEEGWAVIVTYDEDGYVKDDDASKIDYNDLLKQMQKSVHEANAEREKQGYKPIELVGWATPPQYDASSHKFYWAKELKFGESPDHTLNYNIRILGRRGVLVLNAVAGMNQLRQVEGATPRILSMVDFNEGHRYTDFNPSMDKVATYGLAALVAGGVAAKAGFFKVILAFILAAKKAVIALFVAIGVWFKKRFKKGSAPPAPAPAPVASSPDSFEYECTKCGAGVSASAKICPKCGADVSKVE